MYCYTKINHLMSVFNELILWTEISKEHPLFIKNLAERTHRILPPDVLKRLTEINESFALLQKETRELMTRVKYSIKIHCSYMVTLREYIEAFLCLDRQALFIIEELQKSSSEDALWQMLLQHTAEEQTFMYELFNNIYEQLK